MCLLPHPPKSHRNMYGQQGSQRRPSGAVPWPGFQDSQPRETQGGLGSTQERPTPLNTFSQSDTCGDDVFGVGATGSAATYSRESTSRGVRVRRRSTTVYANTHLIPKSPSEFSFRTSPSHSFELGEATHDRGRSLRRVSVII